MSSAKGMGNANRLCCQVLTLLGPTAELIEAQERPWASATFAGARHKMMVRLTLPSADTEAPPALARLPDHEFIVPGEIVADCAVATQRRERDGTGCHVLICTVELLTIDAD